MLERESNNTNGAHNLNEYDNIMNEVNICKWIHCKFTISSIINKWHIVFGIIKYWVYRIVYGIEKRRAT